MAGMRASQDAKPNFSFQEIGTRLGVVGLRIAAALSGVAGITVLCCNIAPPSGAMAGFLYLALVAVVATGWGRVEGGATSAAALLCLDYFFLSPTRSFAIARPADLEGFFGFLAAAITVTLLTARSERAEDSIDRQKEMESLYALSRAILLMDPVRPVAKQIAYQIAQVFKFPAVVLYDRSSGESLCAGPEDMPGIDEKLREAALWGTLFHDRPTNTVITAVRLGGDPIGSVAVRGATLSDSALHALTNLVAIGLERARGQEAAHRAEASRQLQELKSTLLDAIAHEFETPLTSIKAAAAALLSGSFNKVLERRELISIVDEEADRLSRLVSDAIQMAHVESGRSRIARELYPVCTLVDAALAPIKSVLQGREVVLNLEPDLPLVLVDAELIGLAIRKVIDNALKNALPHTPITIHGRAAEGKALIAISENGARLSAPDQTRNFEKPFPSHSEEIGEGKGIAIARKIAAVHGGEIRVQSKPGQRVEVVITLPAAAQEIPA